VPFTLGIGDTPVIAHAPADVAPGLQMHVADAVTGGTQRHRVRRSREVFIEVDKFV